MHSIVPGVDVAGLLRERDRGLREPRAERVVHHRRGRLLDQLLVAPLDGAVALAEEEHVAARVGDDLRLDVVGPVDVALQEHLGAPEVRLRLARRAAERLLELLGVAHDVHALAAAAERRLHEEREPDPLGLLLRLADVDRLGRAGDDRHAAAVGRRPEPPPCRPSARSPRAEGPTNVNPASSTAWAKCARSARNP